VSAGGLLALDVPVRSQLTDLLTSSATALAEADGVKQQLRLKEQEVERCTLDLADEQVGPPGNRSCLRICLLSKAEACCMCKPDIRLAATWVYHTNLCAGGCIRTDTDTDTDAYGQIQIPGQIDLINQTSAAAAAAQSCRWS
jgi:hypothetical protein